ncbi:hypothetical protein ACQKPE_26510 [Pseudomonas sp. NPDC089554]|uniref:DUF4376 domain-containing protein n=1 Tax=Pseudomonas sp. NPDC089554 TaxID=3390653 RepID=UPI003D014874
MSYAVKIDETAYRGVSSRDDVGEDEYFSDAPPALQAVVSPASVDAERDRRIDSGIVFQGVMFQSRATDRENIAGAAQLGFMAMMSGAQPDDLRWSDPSEDFVWIASDNSLVPMDAQTVVEFGKTAAQRKQALIMVGRQLKDMESIPEDYADDKWWP